MRFLTLIDFLVSLVHTSHWSRKLTISRADCCVFGLKANNRFTRIFIEKTKVDKQSGAKKRQRSASSSSDSASSSNSSSSVDKGTKKKQKVEKKSESGESGGSYNDDAEFVAEKKVKNKDFKELLFGEKKHKIDADGEVPTVNYLNGKKYSEKFYTLLDTRKGLPAWAAKK